ncbi:MAG: hypothetical protein EHM13_06470 [Acidobacteria bacterium]|nr:MAG: hypothetical protein EHM13_06470 [Acidobacteriota bacterium]
MTKNVKAKHGWDYFYYGNLSSGGPRPGAATAPGTTRERAWYNDAELYKPRYTQTYFGIRNRIGILVETYSYATFEDRIKSNYWFLEEVIDYAARNAEAIRRATAAADAESIVGKEQAVRGRLVRAPEPVQIVLADSVEERNPYVPDRPMLRRVKGSERVETMPHYATLEATETSIAPRAYVFPAVPPAPGEAPGLMQMGFGGGRQAPSSPYRDNLAVLNRIADRLAAHGIRFSKTDTPITVKGERFRIESSEVEAQEYQGHRIRTLTGKWEPGGQEAPAGSLVVPMDQPLARLAFLLLDPRSDDGLMAWGLMDEMLGKTPSPEFYPVIRTMEGVR